MKILKNERLRMYFVLLLTLFLPTLYSTFRIFWLGNIPSDSGINIASQISWINLIFESVSEMLLLPLFYIIGKSKSNLKDLENKITTGIIFSLTIYLFIIIIINLNLESLLNFMSQRKNLISQSMIYIRLELISILFDVIYNFMMIFLISLNSIKRIFKLLILKTGLNILFDILFISNLNLSFNIGVNGIAISNILNNFILLIIIIIMLKNMNINILKFKKIEFKWILEWIKVGSFSGIESAIRNLTFIFIILKMMNMISNQGNFWIANNFIWGWLLVPILALGNLIKKEISENYNDLNKRLKDYFKTTSFIIFFWIITIPFWKLFLEKMMNVQDSENVIKIIFTLLIFMIVFSYNNIIDSVFYALGRTDLMLIQSLFVNIVYYSFILILYKYGTIKLSVINISLIFGTGILIDSLLTFYLFLYSIKSRSLLKNYN
ncbi:MAG: MATE family efflux transporter [Fusobacterium sp. JB019]|nr:MATE family efflux transporter [Fusobacterium sp. JB019]